METQKIQATITLTLTPEQLLTLLNAAPQNAQPTPAPAPMAAPAPAPMPTQTAPQTYSVQDLGLAARPLMENGRQQELIALLAEFGVQSVAAIPENRRADFAARLRALGGQI